MVQLLEGLAVLAIAVAGLAHGVGATRVRDLAARFAVVGVVLLILVPCLRGAFGRMSAPNVEVTPGAFVCLVAAVTGHLALGIALVRRRFRQNSPDSDVARIRTRRRERLAQPPEDDLT